MAVALCLAICGCGRGGPAIVPVSGQVLIDGKPLSKGNIRFVSETVRPASAMLDADGRFRLSCFDPDDGAIVANYRVAVTGTESVDDHTVLWHAPKKYADENLSGLSADITEPTDSLKFELTWSGAKPFVERD
jgi:hypothetical protein